MVSYEDVGAAADWLVGAFGFVEDGERLTDATGRITHVDLVLDGGHVMLGWPGPAYRAPRRHATTCDEAAAWLAPPWVVDGVLVEVDDVDAHHAHAAGAGAEILRAPESLPVGRLYTAADPEGHRWMFLEPVHEVVRVPDTA
jgi:uncharacterized glyoxalase superfamily protein PhnB